MGLGRSRPGDPASARIAELNGSHGSATKPVTICVIGEGEVELESPSFDEITSLINSGARTIVGVDTDGDRAGVVVANMTDYYENS